MKKLRYQVVVGNIGTVYGGGDRVKAEQEFYEYERQSKVGYGRAAYEPVTLLFDGEVLQEFQAPVLDHAGKPIWNTADMPVFEWMQAGAKTVGPSFQLLLKKLKDYHRVPPASQSWWVVDDMGAEGPFTEDEAEIVCDVPERHVICAASKEEAVAAFRKSVKEGE